MATFQLSRSPQVKELWLGPVLVMNESLTAGPVMRWSQGRGRVEVLSKGGDKKGLSLEAVARGEQSRAPACRGQVCGLPCLRVQCSFSLVFVY